MNRLRTTASPATSARSPFAGCAILVVALLVMVFLIVFSVLTLFRQFNQIARFTSDHPAPVAVTPIDDQEPQLNRLAERLEAFRQKLLDGEAAQLELTPADINLAIAAHEPLREFRGTFHIASIQDDHLRIAISFPLNGKPRLTRHGESGWITSDPRYLNGTLWAKPALVKHELVLLLDAIEVPAAQVPREFIDQMSPYRLTERYLSDPVLGPAMKQLTRVSLADGKLILSRTPDDPPADGLGKTQLTHASRRFFTVLAIISTAFLIGVGAFAFYHLRKRTIR